ncbi:PaaI family thioesterase [uncultured Ramlibacter sp.]|uniref:PaaI family thioesterase n=1 Tax=uncultured Ramlibacter sp. TaxID=260755 RepID=UPI00260A990D|nr:PaaI family thioesterase [uncultured Ramlibacter sp.]
MSADASVSNSPANEEALLANGWKKRSLGGFIDCAGPLWTRKEDTAWAYAILADDRHLNPAGMVHGGLLETLMDHALSAIAWEASGRLKCVTLQLDAHFLAPATKGMLIEARGSVVHRTASMLFMQGLLSVDGQPVMSAQALMKIVAA